MGMNVSNQVWVEDSSHTNGGYWSNVKGGSSGEAYVGSVPPTSLTTTQRDALPSDGVTSGYVYNGLTIRNSTTGYTEVYEGDGTTNDPSDWRLGQQYTDGAAHIYSVDQDTSVSVSHIAAGTVATGSYTAGTWFDRSDYSGGVIELTVVDGTPVGDVTGEFQISHSLDAGVTSSTYETLSAIANIGADDSQVILVDFSSLKNAPYFKVKEVLASATSLAAVTVGVKVYASRLRG